MRLIAAAAVPAALLAGCTLSLSDEAEQIDEARLRLQQCPARQLQITAVELPYRVGSGEVPRLELGDRPERYLRNQLGQVYGFLSGVHPRFDAAPTMAARLDRDLPWNVRLHRCDDDGARFDVAVVVAGADQVDVVAALGRHDGARVVLDEPGRLWAPLAALADPLGTTPAGGMPGELGQVIVDDWDAAEVRLTVGMAFPLERARVAVADPIAAFLTDRLAANDSDYARDVDRDGDGVVSPAELQVDSLFDSLLDPDVEPTPGLPDGGISLVLPVLASAR